MITEIILSLASLKADANSDLPMAQMFWLYVFRIPLIGAPTPFQQIVEAAFLHSH